MGLAAAVELARRGIECLVIEPRVTASHARPRCKTVNVRTLEHLRRWGLADRLRERAPLPVAWSNEIVFCTSLTGFELSRFDGVLGLVPDGDRYPEVGQQAPQYVLEELLRDAVGELDRACSPRARALEGLEQTDAAARVTLGDGTVVTAGRARAWTARAAPSGEGDSAPRTWESTRWRPELRHGLPRPGSWAVGAARPARRRSPGRSTRTRPPAGADRPRRHLVDHRVRRRRGAGEA